MPSARATGAVVSAVPHRPSWPGVAQGAAGVPGATTSTRAGAEGTSPALVARRLVTPWVASRRVACPAASVTALVPPPVTRAPATGLSVPSPGSPYWVAVTEPTTITVTLEPAATRAGTW